MGLAFGTFSIGRNSVARASALVCWISWTRVHAARTRLLLLQIERPRPDRFAKSSLHHAEELPTPPPFAGRAKRRPDRSRSTREPQRVSTSTKSRVCENQLTPPPLPFATVCIIESSTGSGAHAFRSA